MDANRITIIYPDAHPTPEPHSDGGNAVSHAYGLDFDAYTHTPTDTATHGGSYVYAVRLKVARQRAAHAGAAG
jgi:hypothetical protein